MTPEKTQPYICPCCYRANRAVVPKTPGVVREIRCQSCQALIRIITQSAGVAAELIRKAGEWL